MAKGKVNFQSGFFFSCKFYQSWVPLVRTSELRLRAYVYNGGWRIAKISVKAGSSVAGRVIRFFEFALFLVIFFLRTIVQPLLFFFLNFQENFMAEALFAIFLRVIFFTCFMVFSEPFFNSVFFYSSDFLFFFKSVFFKEQNFRLIIFCQPLHALELLPMILKFQQKTPCLRPPAVLNFH